MLAKVLAGSAVVLGLYILIFHIFLRNNSGSYGPDPSYHIGCYDPTNTIRHSTTIQDKIQQINITSYHQSFNMHHSLSLNPNFDDQIKAVAKKFQLYLNEYYKEKIKGQHDLHYHNLLTIAKKNYRDCFAKYYFNEDDCQSNWKILSLELDQFNSLTANLREKMANKEKKQKQISFLIDNYQNNDTKHDPLIIEYDLKINQIKINQRKIKQKILEISQKKQQISRKISPIDQSINQHRLVLSLCEDNYAIIIHCQSVSTTINEGIPTPDINFIKLKIHKKKQLLEKLQERKQKDKKQQNKQSMAMLEQQIHKIKRQLQMLKQTMHSDSQSLCFQCTEFRINQLRLNISNLNDQKQTINKRTKQLEIQKQNYQTDLKNMEEEIQNIEQKFNQAKIQRQQLCETDQCQGQLQNILKKEKILLNQMKTEILSIQSELNIIKLKNKKEIMKMETYVQKISQVQDCLKKKDLYEKMLEFAPQKTGRQAEKRIQNAKAYLTHSLQNITLSK